MDKDLHKEYNIQSKDLEGKSFDGLEAMLKEIRDADVPLSEKEGALSLSFALLDADSQTMRVDEALAQWLKTIEAQAEDFLYFLAKNEKQLKRYAAAFVPTRPEGEERVFYQQELLRFTNDRLKQLSAFCQANDIDPAAILERFASALDIDIEAANEESEGDSPLFTPERISSKFLRDFFRTGYNFHTIDATEEPVLYLLADDPKAAYFAPAEVELEYFESPAYPVISLEMTIFDIPESPLRISFVFNIGYKRHRKELHAYAEMPYITTNFLFWDDDGELNYAFSRALQFDDYLRAQIRTMILEASRALQNIDPGKRDFEAAVKAFFETKSAEAKPAEETTEGADKEGRLGEGEDAAENREKSVDIYAELDAGEEEQSYAKSYDAHYEPSEEEEDNDDDDDDDETSFMLPGDQLGTTKRHVSANAESIPETVLPEPIQRITKALSKPIRDSGKDVMEELSIKPAPKKVAYRDEDPVARLTRRLVILQNKLENAERLNIRLKEKLDQAQQQIESLQRSSLAGESRKWKFWK